MMRETVQGIAAMLMLAVLSGCATVAHGTSKDIFFASSPRGARITVDDSIVGKTPILIPMVRARDHVVRLRLDGYQPERITLQRRTSGLFWVNLLWLDLAGMGVDALSGGMYDFDSTQFLIRLTRSPAAIGIGRDTAQSNYR